MTRAAHQWKKDTWSKSIRNDNSSMEERQLEEDDLKCSEKGGGRVLDGRSTAERSGQVADKVVQTSDGTEW